MILTNFLPLYQNCKLAKLVLIGFLIIKFIVIITNITSLIQSFFHYPLLLATRRRYCRRFLASLHVSPHVKPISQCSASIVLRQVCFGRPGLRLPTGVKFNAVLAVLRSPPLGGRVQSISGGRCQCCLFVGKDLRWIFSEAKRCCKSSADIIVKCTDLVHVCLHNTPTLTQIHRGAQISRYCCTVEAWSVFDFR